MSPSVTQYGTTTHPGGQTSNILNLPPDAIVTSQQQSGGLLAAALPQTPVTTLSSSEMHHHHHQMAVQPQFILHEEHPQTQSDNRIDLGQIVRQTIETNHLQQFDLQVSQDWSQSLRDRPHSKYGSGNSTNPPLCTILYGFS